ncbi:MAG: ATP-dependent 6-phosphofructokinase [Isosphaeraceae bacterium]
MSERLRRVSVADLGPAELPSPLWRGDQDGAGLGRFVPEGRWIRQNIEVRDGIEPTEDLLFEKAGPRQRLAFDPRNATAAIVTCGGLCPGLNSVVRSLFLELHYNYGVPRVLGIRDGYLGLNPTQGPPPIELNAEFVSSIHKEGGTMLGTSRGAQAPSVMVDRLQELGVDFFFTVGGDGTQRGARAIVAEVADRGARIGVIGIPKTIDNDLAYCDRTFGFLTAVEEARDVIHLAHTEARAAVRGIGLVKLMGRYAGFIACAAAVASQETNFCLIPEIPFFLEGRQGFLQALETRMAEREHAVIVVAEGAGQHLFPADLIKYDRSGNPRLNDVGALLKERIVEHFERIENPVDLKYIDPSYIIRSVAPSCEDSLLCDQLARMAAHAAMAGKTDLMIGLVNGAFVHVPLELAVGPKRQVDPRGNLWAAVMATTGQAERYPGD